VKSGWDYDSSTSAPEAFEITRAHKLSINEAVILTPQPATKKRVMSCKGSATYRDNRHQKNFFSKNSRAYAAFSTQTTRQGDWLIPRTVSDLNEQ
jgi:hypothetical protein